MLYQTPDTEEQNTLNNFTQERMSVESNDASRDFFIFFIGTMMAQIISYAIMNWLKKEK